MTDIDPTVRPEPMPEDFDRALRPQMLAEFVGQAEARANLAVFIQSARQRGEAMDHTLIHGPPGLRISGPPGLRASEQQATDFGAAVILKRILKMLLRH